MTRSSKDDDSAISKKKACNYKITKRINVSRKKDYNLNLCL